ncbi:hypothetical protein [Clostridium tagluense]|uniref:Uncharacterized protein n=1 Tax=Clostridium tagluense TaxID=360422 RepID=A0A401USU7_9CLOT|nr:hypothetical protein [Clostridium tagluense]GCD12632.1 hypothetical protein Ctaglu_42550 [Clostridium tagluense]
MLEKIKVKKLLSNYKKMLEKRESLVKPYYTKRNENIILTNDEHAKMILLEARIQQIKEFIDDLKYLIE